MKNKPNKKVIIPPYEYLSEGYDPEKCDKLNKNKKDEYLMKLRLSTLYGNGKFGI